jgi:hypothetical protein
MAGKNPREARQNFLEPLQQALSCVTQAILLRAKSPSDSSLEVLTISNGPARIGRDGRFALNVDQQYRIIEFEGSRGPFKVRTVGYAYTLEEAAHPGAPLLAYHWHPRGHSQITYPHLHIYQCAEIRRLDGRVAHFPTGRVAFEEVLRLLIIDFGVTPIREDWTEVLQRTQDNFEEYRTWP